MCAALSDVVEMLTAVNDIGAESAEFLFSANKGEQLFPCIELPAAEKCHALCWRLNVR